MSTGSRGSEFEDEDHVHEELEEDVVDADGTWVRELLDHSFLIRCSRCCFEPI